jgi:predicted PurR-regulated permease PerM
VVFTQNHLVNQRMPNSQPPVTRDTIETIIVVLLFIGLLYALFNVLEVFFGVLTFALIFSVSFSRSYERLVRLFRGKRKLSSIVYALVLTAIVALPLLFLIKAMSKHLMQLAPWLTMVKAHGLPPLPLFVTNLPVVGASIASFWSNFKESPKDVIGAHEHQINSIVRHVITGGIGVLGIAGQFIVGIIISAFFLERGDHLLIPIKNTVKHLVNEKEGANLLEAITQAIKGVSIGVMGTAFIVAFVAWTGLEICGFPFATGIAALIFFLAVIQVGALPVWVLLIIWEVIQGNRETSIILCIYLIVIVAIQMVVKPVLIAKSGKLPFLVLFLGVVGGLAAWGFTGMFKGAIITAVFYTVFNSWLERKNLSA